MFVNLLLPIAAALQVTCVLALIVAFRNAPLIELAEDDPANRLLGRRE